MRRHCIRNGIENLNMKLDEGTIGGSGEGSYLEVLEELLPGESAS